MLGVAAADIKPRLALPVTCMVPVFSKYQYLVLNNSSTPFTTVYPVGTVLSVRVWYGCRRIAHTRTHRAPNHLLRECVFVRTPVLPSATTVGIWYIKMCSVLDS